MKSSIGTRRCSGWLLLLASGCTSILIAAGCGPTLPPGKPLSALSPEEAAGHEVYQQQCARCHAAYTTQGLHGPSLLGLYRKPFLPSGAPAKDERVTSVILHGRDLMPALGNDINAEQLQDLLRYLHTL